MAGTVTYDSDFDGADFKELFSGGEGGPRPEVADKYTAYDIPDSSDVETISMGVSSAAPFDVPAAVNGLSDLEALEAKVSDTGTLTRPAQTITSLRLVKVSGQRKLRKYDIWKCVLTFVKV